MSKAGRLLRRPSPAWGRRCRMRSVGEEPGADRKPARPGFRLTAEAVATAPRCHGRGAGGHSVQCAAVVGSVRPDMALQAPRIRTMAPTTMSFQCALRAPWTMGAMAGAAGVAAPVAAGGTAAAGP